MIRAFAALFGWLALTSASPALPPVATELIFGDTLPARLSDFRFFTDRGGQRLNARVSSYSLNTPLFSDYAEKQRFVFVPEGMTASYNAEGVFDFPVGTAFIKSFGYPADFREADAPIRLIETRVLLRRASGWVALPYVWNADGTEATFRRAGARMDVSWIDRAGARQAISYRVPNQNQCKTCHERDGEIALIGPSARNLNDGVRLARWTVAGILDRAPANAPRVPVWDDPADGGLAQRARSYLDVNCAHCHSRAGSAANSGLYLGWDETDMTAFGLYKRPVAAGRGSGGFQFDIEPGHPERSILVHRMATDDPGVAMPELGRQIVHAEAIELVSRWIAEMDIPS